MPTVRPDANSAPRDIARDLGWPMGRNRTAFSYADLADEAAARYWDNRVVRSSKCGTVQGYYWHLDSATPPCLECKRQRAKVVAVQRRRAVAA